MALLCLSRIGQHHAWVKQHARYQLAFRSHGAKDSLKRGIVIIENTPSLIEEFDVCLLAWLLGRLSEELPRRRCKTSRKADSLETKSIRPVRFLSYPTSFQPQADDLRIITAISRVKPEGHAIGRQNG